MVVRRRSNRDTLHTTNHKPPPTPPPPPPPITTILKTTTLVSTWLAFRLPGSSGCVLLDDDSSGPRRLDSFSSSLPLGLMSSHGGSITSSLHSLPVGPWQDGHASAGNGKRPSYTSSEVCARARVCVCLFVRLLRLYVVLCCCTTVVCRARWRVSFVVVLCSHREVVGRC